jgi:hypothetical protein
MPSRELKRYEVLTVFAAMAWFIIWRALTHFAGHVAATVWLLASLLAAVTWFFRLPTTTRSSLLAELRAALSRRHAPHPDPVTRWAWRIVFLLLAVVVLFVAARSLGWWPWSTL